MTYPVRTRFAPSPTGHLHIGNARTALMNWIFARHSQGKFILRIEDTDQKRSTKESEKSILADLQWLGLTWDEGPDVGGPYGPYRQSERFEIYQSHLEALIHAGHVYPCYCTPEELEARRMTAIEKGQSPLYDGHCRNLTEEKKKALEAEGKKPAFRFRVPPGETAFEDLVKGKVVFQNETISDFVIVRPDGMPMYNFACVVDDHLMGITHVIRGDDHVSNTPRQILLYRAFGWECPEFAHIPMILGKDRERLSKRHGATSVDQYRALGYLPEALVNFLSLLSWSSASGEEILSKEQLIQEFDFSRVSNSPAVFDTEKLDWMNSMYIRRLDPLELSKRLVPFLHKWNYPIPPEEVWVSLVKLLQNGIEKLSQLGEKAKWFFAENIEFENQEAERLVRTESAIQIGKLFLEKTASMSEWNGEIFKQIMKEIQKETGVKGKDLWMPVRVMLTGNLHGPELHSVAEILGLEKCRKRIKERVGE